MKTIAAVLVETGRPLELADLEVPKLKPGQVFVEIAFSGVCHTQLLECRGYRGADPFLPHCLGHEASGIVIDTGADVTKCCVDDQVILSWIKGSGADVPGSVYDWNGKKVNAGGVTTFMAHAVVSENRVTVLGEGVSLEVASLVGCAGATGAGAVWNAAGVRPSEIVAVFGTGGVGLCAVAAAVQAKADTVIAVDVHPVRLALAKQLGADIVINASKAGPVEQIRAAFPTGIDHSIEASGRPSVMRQALACVRARGGQAVVIGNARFGESLEIDPRELNQGKRLIGTWGGDCEPDRDFAKISRLSVEGSLPLERLIGQHYSLEEMNEALADLETGDVARPLLDMTRKSPE
jgi:S-(hydroxymethyl)glutathione dehydrogenase/alcohol dehydrogenase